MHIYIYIYGCLDAVEELTIALKFSLLGMQLYKIDFFTFQLKFL